mgnify:CR=1 FL=1
MSNQIFTACHHNWQNIQFYETVRIIDADFLLHLLHALDEAQ